MENGTRRYHNLAGVVRDLEHVAETGGTPEGRDLWDRFYAVISACVDEALASSVDADDEPEDDDGPDLGDEPGLGTAGQEDRNRVHGRTGIDATSIDALRAELATLASALAAQPGPQGGVPRGAPAVDGTGTPGTIVNKRRLVGPQTTSEEEVRVNVPTKKKRSTRKRSTRKNRR